MKKIVIIVAQESEDMEVCIPNDIWTRSKNITSTLISFEKGKSVYLSSGMKINCENTIDKINLKGLYDAIYIPGGSGHKKFFLNESVAASLKPNILKLHETLHYFNDNDAKYIFALCAAPSVLGEIGILDGVNATCYPGYETSFEATYQNQPIVYDKQILTGNGPANALEFALKAVEILDSKEEADRIAKEILLK